MAYEVGKQYFDRIGELAQTCVENDHIDQQLYYDYDVKRGLRDSNGKGVLAGLTEISDIVATRVDESGNKVPADGELYYRGYNVKDLISRYQFSGGQNFGFEEVSYLLIFGELGL